MNIINCKISKDNNKQSRHRHHGTQQTTISPLKLTQAMRGVGPVARLRSSWTISGFIMFDITGLLLPVWSHFMPFSWISYRGIFKYPSYPELSRVMDSIRDMFRNMLSSLFHDVPLEQQNTFFLVHTTWRPLSRIININFNIIRRKMDGKLDGTWIKTGWWLGHPSEKY